MTIRLVAILAGLLALLSVIACGGYSDEEKLLLSIYSDNIDARTTELLRSEGNAPATDTEYDWICARWDEVDYRANDYEDMAAAAYIWQQDTGASDTERDRLSEVWVALDAVTSVLHRELDTIYTAKDFCEFNY